MNIVHFEELQKLKYKTEKPKRDLLSTYKAILIHILYNLMKP